MTGSASVSDACLVRMTETLADPVILTTDPETLVGRQNDGISKRFGHANQACVGEAHRNVRVLLDQSHNGLHAVGKFEGDQQSTAAKQCAEIGCAASSEKVEGLR